MLKNLLPIRKVAVGLLASLLILGLRQAGVTLGSDDADNYANGLVGFVVSYLVPDPRVQKVVHKPGLREKLRLLNGLILRAYAGEQMKQGEGQVLRPSTLTTTIPPTAQSAPSVTGTAGETNV